MQQAAAQSLVLRSPRAVPHLSNARRSHYRYRCRVSEGTLRNWRATRIGPSFLKIGKAFLYPSANSIVGTNSI